MTVNPLAKTAEPTGFRKFIRADKTQRVLLIVSFMFVPLVLLLMFTYIPFGKMVQFSFYNRNYLSEGTFISPKESFSMRYSITFLPSGPLPVFYHFTIAGPLKKYKRA